MNDARDRTDDTPTDELVGELQETIARLQSERDEALAARQRALADFSNFQRRANEAEIRALAGGSARAVKALLPALDHFDLALGQDRSSMTVDGLLDGVRMVRAEMSRALEGLGVVEIAPARGEEFDPQRHEAMLRQEDPQLGPGQVVQTYQAGYALGDMVLRPAKVVVSGG